jgi:hypothetical protein
MVEPGNARATADVRSNDGRRCRRPSRCMRVGASEGYSSELRSSHPGLAPLFRSSLSDSSADRPLTRSLVPRSLPRDAPIPSREDLSLPCRSPLCRSLSCRLLVCLPPCRLLLCLSLSEREPDASRGA